MIEKLIILLFGTVLFSIFLLLFIFWGRLFEKWKENIEKKRINLNEYKIPNSIDKNQQHIYSTYFGLRFQRVYFCLYIYKDFFLIQCFYLFIRGKHFIVFMKDIKYIEKYKLGLK